MTLPLKRGVRLFNLSECGATFAYPDALPPEDWISMQGVRRGWVQLENEKQAEPPKK